jgi:hypothetical protein
MPREVRDKIYSLVVITEPGVIVCHPCDEDDLEILKAKVENGTPGRYSLLLVNKQVSAEAFLVFYASNTFHFMLPPLPDGPDMRGIKAFLERVPVERLEQIKNVALTPFLGGKEWHTNSDILVKRKKTFGQDRTKQKQSFCQRTHGRLEVARSKSVRKMIDACPGAWLNYDNPDGHQIFSYLLITSILLKSCAPLSDRQFRQYVGSL